MLVLSNSIAILLLLVTLFGVWSYGTGNAYEVINLYGEKIKIWGTGIYMHDSYFKASIFIGSDFTMMVFILPLYIRTSWKLQKDKSVENYISNFGVLSLISYDSASLFGVTYNSLHLLYIFLFGASFYYATFHFIKLFALGSLRNKVCKYKITRGMKVFLIIAGISLFVTWFPDILHSLNNRTFLDLVEIDTTEITYVLDMGIISPLMFITLYLVKQKNLWVMYSYECYSKFVW